jgi:hypothetical protein
MSKADTRAESYFSFIDNSNGWFLMAAEVGLFVLLETARSKHPRVKASTNSMNQLDEASFKHS